MKVSILYVTFQRDLDFLRFSLESVRKYATGFSGITIVVPEWDVSKFLQFERYSTPECPVLIKNFLEYPGKGFVHHLAMKCYADVFCPDADFILHMDPDCLFHEKVTPADYFKTERTYCASEKGYFDSDRPVLIVEPYEVVQRYFPGRYNWKAVTELALKFDCPYETMCCHPSIHPRETYRGLRDYMESVHMTPFMDFVLKQRNKFPQTFGEHNSLGSWALKFTPDRYHIVNCGPARLARMDELRKNPELKIGHPHQKLTQFWSYEGTAKNMASIRKILA